MTIIVKIVIMAKMMHEVEKFDWPPLLAWNGTISTKVTAIERSRYVMHVAMVAKFLDLLIENVTFIMTFLCMITLRVKLVDHTFRLSFNNANGRLCPKRLLKWRDVVTMVTWRHTPPFFPLNACLTKKKTSLKRFNSSPYNQSSKQFRSVSTNHPSFEENITVSMADLFVKLNSCMRSRYSWHEI